MAFETSYTTYYSVICTADAKRFGQVHSMGFNLLHLFLEKYSQGQKLSTMICNLHLIVQKSISIPLGAVMI